jgi:hypothetical protein
VLSVRVLERRSLPRRLVSSKSDEDGSQRRLVRPGEPIWKSVLLRKTHCPKPPADVISLRSDKTKRPEPKFNQNHFAQLRLLSISKPRKFQTKDSA